MESKKYTKLEKSWILYDCANSAYAIAMMTALFPIYFGMVTTGSGMDFGYYVSFSSIIIAILSPILGTYADYKGQKSKFFNFFTLLGMIATFALSFIPGVNLKMLMIVYVVSRIGYAGSNIFYDAFLVDITEDERMDRISSAGFAYGYIASVIPFIFSLIVIKLIGEDNGLGYQISFGITALWWFVLTIPMFKDVKQIFYIEPESRPIYNSFKRLVDTFKNIKQHKVVALFLVAYFLYIDGVDTFISMVVPYAQEVLEGEFSPVFMLAILLLIQVVAFPCAIIYGKLAEKYGAKKLIWVGIFTYLVTAILGYFVANNVHVVVLAMLVASAQGGIQALSRSYYAKIIPKEKSNEFFGFYNVFGKFAAILGPFIMSSITTLTGNARLSILGLIPLFIGGFAIMFLLPKDK